MNQIKDLMNKRLISRFALYCIMLTLGILITGCRSSKEVTKRATANDVVKLESFLHTSLPFKTMEAKADFKLAARAGVGTSVKGSIRMSKDSCIIISIQPFIGIEAVKCLIAKDSIVFVSRLHQSYSVERLDNFAYKEFLNISVLQDLLLNRMFVPGKIAPDERTIARFDRLHQKEASGYRWGEDSFILDFFLNDDGEYARLKAYRPEKGESVNVKYGQFKPETFGDFPRQVEISTEGLPQNLNLQVIYSKPSFDESTSFQFEIPSKYKRVTTTELIKRFQDMI
jgi:hypothetical protein